MNSVYTLALCTLGVVARSGAAQSRKSSESIAHYADVNGLRMYYETHGPVTGRPLVLLHGAFSNIQTDFGKLIPELARAHRVIGIETQAHGHTSDAARQLTYEQMADDVAELLKQLGVDSADFVGYSMGGGTAIQVAVRHPSLVRKIVWIGGAAYSPDGFQPGLLEGEAKMTPKDLEGTPWHQAYVKIAPNPAAFPTLVEKMKTLDTKWTGFSESSIKQIVAPIMLVVGDADASTPEHVAKFFRLLGGGVMGDMMPMPPARLAILPGTTHVTIVQRTDWLRSMILEFIDPASTSAKP